MHGAAGLLPTIDLAHPHPVLSTYAAFNPQFSPPSSSPTAGRGPLALHTYSSIGKLNMDSAYLCEDKAGLERIKRASSCKTRYVLIFPSVGVMPLENAGRTTPAGI